jgi:hypothetical protein
MIGNLWHFSVSQKATNKSCRRCLIHHRTGSFEAPSAVCRYNLIPLQVLFGFEYRERAENGDLTDMTIDNIFPQRKKRETADRTAFIPLVLIALTTKMPLAVFCVFFLAICIQMPKCLGV